MNKTYSIIGGIIGFLVLIALIIGGSYNSLVGAQTKVDTLVELWDEIVGREDIPPLWVMLDRTYTASAAWRSDRN